ncbi:MAG TPA: hydrolase [Phycisphaerae bacterium]|jgi:glutamate carboxypeptidase
MAKRFEIELRWIDSQAERMEGLLARWAGVNTGSYNLEGLGKFAKLMREMFEELGTEMREVATGGQRIINDAGQAELRELGRVLTGVRAGVEGAARVLLGIHYDTVYGEQEAFQNVRLEGEKMFGPGVCDAKGGLVVLFFALMALERSSVARGISWEVILNPDEELGSPGSAGIFEEAARRNDVGLLFEPALPDGALVSGRKGSGNFTLVAHGRSAHAGRDPAAGRNAINALAAGIVGLEAIGKEMAGVTVNTGFVHGGGAVNVVPDLAMCRCNVRVETVEQQRAVEARLAELCAGIGRMDGIRCELHGGFASPPKAMTAGMEELLRAFAECGKEIGVPVSWRSTGGACDGNRLAAAGLVNVDSLGVRGGNIHTDQEFMMRASLAERAKLTALFLLRLAAGEIVLEKTVKRKDEVMR